MKKSLMPLCKTLCQVANNKLYYLPSIMALHETKTIWCKMDYVFVNSTLFFLHYPVFSFFLVVLFLLIDLKKLYDFFL